jgi:hypothetical protein
MGYQRVSLTQGQRFRQMHLDEQTSADIANTWRQLRQPGLLEKHKDLALGLRRLNYQAHRERVEDEMAVPIGFRT